MNPRDSKKLSTVILIFILSFMLLINSCFSVSVIASTGELFSRDNMIKLAKGIAVLYLLNRANQLIENQSDRTGEIREEERLIDYQDLSTEALDGRVIVIDPGHGGSDPGAVGPGGLLEKEVNLNIARNLYNLLKENTAAEVYLTRADDRYLPLGQRSSIACEKRADIFISIHLNGDVKRTENGIETYAHYGGSRETWALAWYIQESLVKELGLSDRGLKADNFQVLRETRNSMKSLLLEIGFITNPAEETFLKKKDIQQRAAEAIYRGILNYYAAST